MLKLSLIKILYGLLTEKRNIGILNFKRVVVCGGDIISSIVFLSFFHWNPKILNRYLLLGWQRSNEPKVIGNNREVYKKK